ncbi:MAG: hypothetical protein ABFR82_08435 [Nitrospirota bacterium]
MFLIKSLTALFVLLIIICTAFITESHAYELSGHATAEGRLFFNDAPYHGQERDSASLAVQPEFYHEWESGSSFTFTPFGRLDSADSERSHLDVRELHYLWLHENWELRIGISKVFWGVTEFVHLVDIINQTDAVEYLDGEDKLGQPMAYLSVPLDWGVVDIFLLPYFRERTFPGENGRLRSSVVVNTDEVIYESSAEEYHTDFAVRYSHTIGDWDFGIYHFNGTAREPALLLRADSSCNPFFAPYYEQINQTGLDVQMVMGSWLFKAETIYRTGQDEDFFAAVEGFEYSFFNISSSGIDLGLIVEWAYDEREDNATTAFENDLMIGARLAFNDPESTEALIGITQDLDSKGSGFSIESSRRLTDHLKITLDAFMVLDSAEKDTFHQIRDDDNVQIELSYYF